MFLVPSIEMYTGPLPVFTRENVLYLPLVNEKANSSSHGHGLEKEFCCCRAKWNVLMAAPLQSLLLIG